MAARATLKAINDELTKRGHNARLEKASGYFCEATDWMDRTVQAAAVGTLTLDQWIGEFVRLKKLNAENMKGNPSRTSKAARPKRG